jgi:hypothetical protein
MASKPEILGQEILEQLLAQTDEYGGAFAYITGAMGGGKTSAMLSWLVYHLKHHPDQKIFFSETYDAPLQTFKVGGLDYIHFMIKEGAGVEFRDRNKKLKDVTKDWNPTYFTTYADLYEKAKPGMVNTVFFGNRTKWMDFIAYMRHTTAWDHIFIDEIGEVIPSNTSGKLHKRIGQFAIFAKDIRKCRMKVIANTQSVRDMDWRVIDKFMYRVFLPGAMADRKHSRVTQKAIDNLQGDMNHGNDAYIDRLGKFGKISFLDIFVPNHEISIEAHNSNLEEYTAINEENDEEMTRQQRYHARQKKAKEQGKTDEEDSILAKAEKQTLSGT